MAPSPVRRGPGSESGFTLVELLVGVVLFGVLGSMIAGFVVSSSRAVDNSRQLHDINEEARLSLVRMSRELRQAASLDAATLYASGAYATAGYASSITFSVDFNGVNGIEPNAVDPEVLTYRYLPDGSGQGNGQIQLTANDASGASIVRPILAAHVSDFRLELRSSQWACDGNGDGVTTWRELDTSARAACPHPDGNGVLGANELGQVDSVVLAFSVFKGVHKQDYSTQINLRNVGI